MAAWTARQQRGLGIWYVVVAAITLVVALVQAPVSEWGALGWLLGAAVLLLGIAGLFQAVTGRGNTRSSTMSQGRQRKWAIFGLAAVTIAAVGTLIANLASWEVQDTLLVGTWMALLGLFISQLATLGRD